MSVFDALMSYNERVNQDIVTNPDFIETIASGRARDSVLEENNVSIKESNDKTIFQKKAVSYLTATDTGRQANINNSGGLYDGIFEWLKYKKYGIDYDSEEERKSIAYAITTKIAKEGSYKYRNIDKRTKVVLDAVNGNIPRLLVDLGTSKKVEIQDNISESYDN